MKILFDHQLFSWQRFGGASKYFAQLMAHLPKDCWDTTTVFSNNAYVDALGLFPHKHFLPNHLFKGQGLIMHLLNKPYSSYCLWQKNYDVYHQMHFDPYGIKYIGNKPMVTTFHDKNFSTLNPKPKVVRWQKKSLSRANKIITISNNTKRDLIELFDIQPDKVEVIYHGIDRKPIPTDKPIFDFPYILYVGTREKHKNFNKFLMAYSHYSKSFPEVKLICTWKQFSKEELLKIGKLHLEGKVVHHAASEHDMALLYRDALFFVFPSLYEGFGMPILEAMSYGCPVVLSNASCFPEIAQDAGLYFDPSAVDDMESAMSQMTESDELRKKMIERGNHRVTEFSWDKCAQEHMKVYHQLL